MADYIKLPTGLVEAEDFLNYCGIAFEPRRLEGKRIPLMLRFRFYLEAVELEGRITADSTPEECQAALRWCLEKALRDVAGGSGGSAADPKEALAAWSEGCLSTSACASCKAECGTA
jgi:hypothetical protein